MADKCEWTVERDRVRAAFKRVARVAWINASSYPHDQIEADIADVEGVIRDAREALMAAKFDKEALVTESNV
jgi:hypothetical protein